MESLSVVGALADRDDNGFRLFELDEFRMTGFSVDQCPNLKTTVLRSDDGAISVQHLEQPQWLKLQSGVEQNFQIVQQHHVAGY